MLATRDAKGMETFKASVGKAQQEVAALEKMDMPSDLAAMLATVKAGIFKYAQAFEKTAPNLMRRVDLYYNSITPVIVSAIDSMDKVKSAIDVAFARTTAETGDRIDTTITLQETVAGAAAWSAFWWRSSSPAASSCHCPA
jgi:hypothetical protein